MVSATRMTVSLKTDLRFPDTGHYGHGSRIIHYYVIADLSTWAENSPERSELERFDSFSEEV